MSRNPHVMRTPKIAQSASKSRTLPHETTLGSKPVHTTQVNVTDLESPIHTKKPATKHSAWFITLNLNVPFKDPNDSMLRPLANAFAETLPKYTFHQQTCGGLDHRQFAFQVRCGKRSAAGIPALSRPHSNQAQKCHQVGLQEIQGVGLQRTLQEVSKGWHT